MKKRHKNTDTEERSISQFNNDVICWGGYAYTKNGSLSSRLANNSLTEATRKIIKIKGKKVLDVGCGDGTYTNELFISENPEYMVGIDASSEAIKKASQTYKHKKNLIFKVNSCYKILYPKKHFDIAIVRGLIHHLDSPEKAIKEIMRVAKKILILDPNGNNPFSKIIETTSFYHRQHNEKSYLPEEIKRWIKNQGGITEKEMYVGLVPFFSPDLVAAVLKIIEPLIEKVSLLRQYLCAVYIIKAATHI